MSKRELEKFANAFAKVCEVANFISDKFAKFANAFANLSGDDLC